MKYLFILFLFFSNIVWAVPSSEQVALAIEKLEHHIQNSVDKKQIPGCAIAVIYKNQIVYLKGYGLRAVGKPEKIDGDTVFQLGSVSKPVAATLAAVLEQKGLLNLDAPVTQYLPKFSLNSKQDADHLKIINVLSHSTGLSRAGFNDLIETYTPYEDMVHKLQTTRVIAPVGKRYDYHNVMYSLIGEITKAVTHEPFRVALSQYLLTPLQMTRTSASFEGLLSTENRASPHIKKKGVLCACVPYSYSYYAVAPAGGVNSTARDMGTFLKAQMDGYPKVVNEKALARIQTPYVPTHNQLNFYPGAATRIKNPHYGLGWRIVEFNDQKFIYHGGWLRGFTNFVGFMPEEQIGVVVLHNGDNHFSSRAAMKFFEVAMNLPEATPPPAKEKKAAKKGKGKKSSKKKVKSKKKKKE